MPRFGGGGLFLRPLTVEKNDQLKHVALQGLQYNVMGCYSESKERRYEQYDRTHGKEVRRMWGRFRSKFQSK
jgi:hypothetical protein